MSEYIFAAPCYASVDLLRSRLLPEEQLSAHRALHDPENSRIERGIRMSELGVISDRRGLVPVLSDHAWQDRSRPVRLAMAAQTIQSP